MKLRYYVTANLDEETAEALEAEATQRKMRFATFARWVLEQEAAKLRARQAGTATNGQQSELQSA